MSLDYAILGFLNYQPFSGYDLKKAFNASVRHFWPADQSQIYRTLNRLTQHGWAEVDVVEQTDRPDRKVYHITPAGREELHHWLESSIPEGDVRNAPLIQVFFAGQLTDDQVLGKFEQTSSYMRMLLSRYAQVPQQIEEYSAMVGSDREEFFWMLTLELGIKTIQAQLEWTESVIQRIKDKKVPLG